MAEFSVRRQRGRIDRFDERTATGVVVIGRTKHRFQITCFRGASPRYPRAGDVVDAVLSADGRRLISVWGRVHKINFRRR